MIKLTLHRRTTKACTLDRLPLTAGRKRLMTSGHTLHRLANNTYREYNKKAVLSQGEPCDAAVNFDPLSNLQRHLAVSLPHAGVNLRLWARIFLQLFGREIIFEAFQPMWPRYLNVTDGQTDRQTTYCGITALCVATHGKHSAIGSLRYTNRSNMTFMWQRTGIVEPYIFQHSHSDGNHSHSHSHSYGNVFFIPILTGIPLGIPFPCTPVL